MHINVQLFKIFVSKRSVSGPSYLKLYSFVTCNMAVNDNECEAGMSGL